MPCLVLHAGFLNEQSGLLLSKKESGRDRMRAYCGSLHFDEVHFLGSPMISEPLPHNYFVHDLIPRTQRSFIEALQSLFKDAQGTMVYSWCDYPFLSLALTECLLDLHQAQYCEYTFADAYPEGMAPEILELSTLSALHALSDDTELSRRTLFDILAKDVNAFDIETHVADYDYRMLRCVLSTHHKRDFLLCKRIAQHTDFESDEKVLTLLREKRQILRTLPSYFLVQVTDTHPAPPCYEPDDLYLRADKAHHWMSAEKFSALLLQMKDFAPNAVLEIGYAGEVSLHPELSELCNIIRGEERNVYLRSSGLGWQDEDVDSLIASFPPQLQIIFYLDAANPDVYRKIYGVDMSEALHTVERFLEAVPSQVHVQLTRIREFENEVASFYQYWKERTSHIIIQKYNHYCGTLPQRKVVDLSPLHRFPCWQLERDMTILLDGRVPFCAQDYTAKHSRGNVFSDKLDELWKKGDLEFKSHVREEYPLLCQNCDEYYIFHA